MSQHRDVIVVGLGGTGSAAAHHLAERGARVLGVDQRSRPYEREAGDTRIVRNTYPDHPAYVPLLVRAWELWRRLERTSGLDLARAAGGLVVGPGGGRLVGETIRAVEQWGEPVEVLGAADIARRFPAFRADEDDLAVHDPWAGHVRPGAAVAAQARQARRFGAELRFGERVVGWESVRGGRVRVGTESGTYVAGQLVLCPGAWAPDVLPDLDVGLRGRRHDRVRLRSSGESAGDGDPPVCVWEDGHGDRISVWPTGPGSSEVTALSHAEGIGDRGLADRVARRLPGWARAGRTPPAVSTRAVDDHLVVGQHPRHEGVTVACGLSDHGAGLVPVIGEVLADLVLNSSTIHPVEMFSPQRQPAMDVTGSRA